MTWQTDAPYWMEIGGQRLECQAWGAAPENAPTVVLLHEGLGSLGQWKDFPQRLAEASGYGVFAWSRAGYGRSSRVTLPRPLDYMTREAMDVLPAILDAIGFQRGVLLGHSDGASIATIYAGSVSDFRVRGLVLIAPHFFTEPEGLKSIVAAKNEFDTGELRDRLAVWHDDPDNAFRGWNDAWLDTGFREWNIEETIAYLRIPVLAIQGRNDTYGTLAQLDALEVGTYSPLDTEILDDCGHAPHLEHQDRSLAIVNDFLKRLDTIEAQVVKVA
jgi:pimeloyl-ACP methyl ester carboxylesterase